MESLARPFFHHRRKLSSSNVMSFSGKDAYDDVLLGAPKSKLGGVGASRGGGVVAVEDYGEIFGGGCGVVGGTVKRGSSIPVLDLSELDKSNGLYDSRRFNGKLDYSKIFGGFSADVVDDDAGMGVPPYEELFGGVKKAKCDKAKARTPADIRSPPKGSECFNSSENSRGFSSEASDQFLDGGKQLNMSYHKTNQRAKDGLNGTTHIAQLHAVPGFAYFIDEATHLQKIEQDKPFPQIKTDAIHGRNSSGDLSEGKSSRRSKWRLPDRQTSEGVVSGKDDNSQGEFDFNPYASKVSMPSSSSANSNDNQGHPEQAKSSSSGPKAEASEKDSNGYLSPSSDEELDVNSAAAASAAALKKAIQQAQESIRLAKEIMEKRKDLVRNSKSRVNKSLKVKAKKEIKYDQDVSGFRKNSIEKAHKTISSEVQAFGGYDQKIARGSDRVTSGFTCRENLSADSKVDTEKHERSAAVTEEQGVGTWFSQLLNNGKNKMAALASQLVDNRNTVFPTTSKHLDEAKETIPAKETLERGTADPGDINAKPDDRSKVPYLEKNLDKSVLNQFMQVGKESVTFMSAQEEQTPDVEHGFQLQENCEKKLEDVEETTHYRHFEPEVQENGQPAKELRNIVEMKKEGEKSFELEIRRQLEVQENGQPAKELRNIVETKKEGEKSFELEIRRQLDNVFIRLEKESILDEEENWRMQENSCLQKGDEHKPKEDNVIESSDEKPESSHDSGNRLEDYHQQDIALQSSMCSLDKVGNKNKSEEENLYEYIDQTDVMTSQHEHKDGIEACVDNSAKSEDVKVYLEVPESCDTEGQPDESEENPGLGLFPGAENEENFNSCNNDESTVSEGTPQALEVNNTSQWTRQEEADDQKLAKGLPESREENGHIEQSVEEVLVIKENKMFETSSLGQCVSHEHILESVIQDVSEAFASDDNAKDFGSDTAIHEERLSTDKSLLKATVLNTEVHDIENDNAIKDPIVGENTSDCEFADMNGQKETEGSDEESESCSRPANCKGLVHECEADRETIKEDGIACDREVEKHNFELDNREKEWVEKQLEPESSQLPCETKESEEQLETDTETKADQTMENYEENICKTSAKQEKENRESVQKEVKEKDFVKNIEVDRREREREKDRIAVERAIREARERAFAEARERAERAAVERANAEVRQRAMAGTRGKLEKASAGTKASSDKATTEAKLRAERAAVERATAEARERALEKALSQKSTGETRSQLEHAVSGKSSAASRDAGLKHSFSSSDLEGTNNESAQRRKARLERHQRIMERAAKALAEKNMRDILAQREQAERNRFAETLDADIKRWASGKEGNLRALLSTLQYILGPDSGWQAISLTEIITTTAVKKAYRKATLYVHPDKLQQRGASIQQKYICEKVFDLLKAAWNKFISEER